MDESAESRPDYFVQSLDRGLSVIRSFSKAAPHQTLTDVAEATGLTRAAARRFLLTLADLGYVRSAGREFFLTPKVLELGYAYLASSTLTELVEPHLVQLVEEIQAHPDIPAFDAGVAILDGDEIVYVAQVRLAGLLQLNIATGARFPAYVTSMGRVLLASADDGDLDAYIRRAHLDRLTSRTLTTKKAFRDAIVEVRKQGWAVVDREYEEWLRAYAVPVAGRDGNVVASLSVSVRANGDDEKTMRDALLPLLQAAATSIEADLTMMPVAPGARLASPEPTA